MKSELTVGLVWRHDLHFSALSGSGHTIELDNAETGPGTGASPMELLLTSLAGCSAMDIISILRKKRQPVEAMEVRIRGQRAETYPRVYTLIEIEYLFRGAGLDHQAIERAIELTREKYCPVWAMLAPTTTIEASYRIEPS